MMAMSIYHRPTQCHEDHSFILHLGGIVSVSKAMKQALHPPSAPEDIILFSKSDILRSGPEDFSSAKVQATCEALGMGCLSFVFCHADIGPINIIVKDAPTTGKIWIVDFEIAGCFPRSWIRTKFRLCSGMKPDLFGPE
jgi:Choline/ethanolamine kinase